MTRSAFAAAGAMLLAGCSAPPVDGRRAPVTAASRAVAPDAVVRTFLTGALAGRPVAREWGGSDGDLRLAVAAIGRARGAVAVGVPTDGDAGMGQRYVTVPFEIGGVGGSAMLHRVAGGIASVDPPAHGWRVRSLVFPGDRSQRVVP